MTIAAVQDLVSLAPRVMPLPASSVDTRAPAPLHPLTKFVPLDFKPAPPQMVIPGFVQAGLVVIAGSPGVGKTTALVPLALKAAGVHEDGDEMAPRHWRHVIYISEDVQQVNRIVTGVVKFAGFRNATDKVAERFHLVAALRMAPNEVAEVGPTYRERFTRKVNGVEIPPLVVIDTRSATIEVSDENDNAEAGRTVALFKQKFADIPVWLVGHLPKALGSRKDAQALSMRGASAIEGDAHQTIFIVAEQDTRYLVLGKRRFEPRWDELPIRSERSSINATDEFGEAKELTLRWGIAAPSALSRKDAKAKALEEQQREDEANLRDAVRDAIDIAWRSGVPLNRQGVYAKLRRKRADVCAVIERLLNEQWLYEVDVPSKERTNSRRSSFLVNLTTEEHEALLRGEGLPPEKLVIPESWRKPAVPSVPAADSGKERAGQKTTPKKSKSVRSAKSSIPKKKTLRNGRTGSDGPRPPSNSGDQGTDGNERE